MNETDTEVTYQQAEIRELKPVRTPVGIRIVCVLLALVAVGLGFLAYQENSALADAGNQLLRAKSENATTQAKFDKANAQSADLQSRLTVANARTTDLQTRFQKAQGQVADLQSQLKKAQSTGTDMRSQLDSAKSQLSDAQAQLTQANNGTSDLRQQLAQAKSQAAEAQSQLAKAQSDLASMQPVAAKEMKMPVATSFKKGFLSSEFTMHITNQGTSVLTVAIAVAGGKNAPPTFALIKSGSTYDVGHLVSGTKVIVTSEGYTPLNLTVP